MFRNLQTKTNRNLVFPPTDSRKTASEETENYQCKRVLDTELYESKDD